jgi:hypothetical protein
MGKLSSRILELLRAGALAAGTAFLLGVWFQGMARLGFRSDYPDGLADFLVVMLAGVVVGTTLGFPAPAARPIHVLGRALAAAFLGILLVVAFGGLGALIVRLTDAAESDLPVYFLAAGGLMVGLGLRRVPRPLPVRIALGIAVAFLVVTRILAAWPEGAHAVTRQLFPLPPGTVRAELERIGWGQLQISNRTRIVAFDTTPHYRTEHTRLASDSRIKFTLEVVTPFYEDACGRAHGKQPEVPALVRSFASREACEREHPARRVGMFERNRMGTSPCCLFEVKQRHAGEQIGATRQWTFIFHEREWIAE